MSATKHGHTFQRSPGGLGYGFSIIGLNPAGTLFDCDILPETFPNLS